jgi:hypothetical protein
MGLELISAAITGPVAVSESTSRTSSAAATLSSTDRTTKYSSMAQGVVV